jgi:hypothetical protein
MIEVLENIKSESYNGWKVLATKNQWLKLYIAQQFGGRLLQLEMDGYPFFFVNPNLIGIEPDSTRLGPHGTWLNYGGEKIWPAPQGFDSPNEWPGPPDPILDGGVYALTTKNSEEGGFILTSPFDPYTGLQITREVVLSEVKSEVKIRVTFENKGTIPQSWSVWPVCQLNAPGEITQNKYQIVCPLNTESQFENGYKVMHGLANNPQYQSDEFGNLVVDYQYLVGKIGLDANANWVAFINRENGKVFVMRYTYMSDHIYPENTSVHIWIQGRGMFYSRNRVVELENDKKKNPPYIEMELLSPLQEMQPGDRLHFDYRMQACTVPAIGGIALVNDFGVISSPLKISGHEGKISVSGKYGVFADGKLFLKYLDGTLSDNSITICEWKVSPLEGLSFDLDISGIIASQSGGNRIVAEFKGENISGVLDELILN